MMQSNLWESVERNSGENPESIAFSSQGQTLSYQQLKQYSENLAGHLSSGQSIKGKCVGICMPRCVETAVAMYAIFRAGGIMVPLDPKMPVDRLTFILNECNIDQLICTPVTLPVCKKVENKVGSIYTLLAQGKAIKVEDQIIVESSSISFPSVQQEDPAYLIFTSGSTGQPKGILHTHGSGLSYARLTRKLYQIGNADVIANHAPIFFDISTLGYLTGPYSGAKTLIISDAETIFSRNLKIRVIQEGVTIWYAVPLALYQLIQSNQWSVGEWSSLRLIMYGGEPFPIFQLKEVMRLFPKALISNVYGPAEVNQCTYYNFNSLAEDEEEVPLGQVWNETHALVLDENEESITYGMGELCIHSSTMMKGYWNNNALTEDSFYEQNGVKYYKTGDLVKKAEGLLFYRGRKDHQVKIRGYRVELAGVDQVLTEIDEISGAASVVIEKEDGSKKIVAALTLKRGAEISRDQILTCVGNKLPAYALPSELFILHSLPTTPTGKIDRIAIQKIYNAEKYIRKI